MVTISTAICFMPRFTLTQLCLIIGSIVFLLQIIMIRIDTKNMLENTEKLTENIRIFVQMYEFKSPQNQKEMPPRLAQQPNLREMSPQMIMEPPVVQAMPPMIPLPTLSYNHVIDMKTLPKSSSGLLITSRLFGITSRAGLGNQLFELCSLLGIASQVKRTPFINVALTDLMSLLSQNILPRYPLLLEQFNLRFHYQGYELITFNAPMCCKYDNVSRLKGLDFQSIYLDGSYKYFHHLRNEIREWLTPHPFIAQTAKDLVPANLRHHHSVICVHTRRGDFVTDGYHKPSDEWFTLAATKYLIHKNKLKKKKSSVLVMGNDPLWSGLLFMDVPNAKVITNSNPEQDFSISQQFCDIVLITAPSSTFGFWLAYLAKEGASVYYRDIFETREMVLREFYPRDFFPPNWIKMTYSDGKISV